MIKQTLSQKLQQRLSPQQIQLMKLLQVPTVSLEQRIKEELEVNPALEEGIESDQDEWLDSSNSEENTEQPSSGLEDYMQNYIEEDSYSYKTISERVGMEEERTIPIPVEISLHEYLENQLQLLNLKDESKLRIASQIIGSIDEDGYLRRDLSAIVDDLMFTENIFVSEKEVKEILRRIQQFEPSGIAARDLRECLQIQLQQRLAIQDYGSFDQMEYLVLAQEIIVHHFDIFSKKHFDKLEQLLEIDEETLKGTIQEIVKLNPKPASGFSGSNTRNQQQYVVPDFTLTTEDGQLELTLNGRNAPDLKISEQYQQMLLGYFAKARQQKATRLEKETAQFVKQKIDNARWFIEAIRQRHQTMYSVMQAILEYQVEYFLTGDQRKLRPMILKDIADVTKLDVSTISRVVNSKYVQTEFGTKNLKEFFSEGMQTESGEEVSTIEVKEVLHEFIINENKRKPLSDEKLTELLQEKGYNIARRTVAKYREQLSIPVARLRKAL